MSGGHLSRSVVLKDSYVNVFKFLYTYLVLQTIESTLGPGDTTMFRVLIKV